MMPINQTILDNPIYKQETFWDWDSKDYETGAKFAHVKQNDNSATKETIFTGVDK